MKPKAIQTPSFIIPYQAQSYPDNIPPFDTDAFYEIFISNLAVMLGGPVVEAFKLNTIWIEKDRNGNEIGIYKHLSKNEYSRDEEGEKRDFAFKNDPNWKKAVNFLESSSICLNTDFFSHKKDAFIISQVFYSYKKEKEVYKAESAFSKLESTFFQEIPMKVYTKGENFQVLPNSLKFSNTGSIPFSSTSKPYLSPREQFILAESFIVDTIVSSFYDPDQEVEGREREVAFLPLPIFHLCELVGVAYIIYDPLKLTKYPTAPHEFKKDNKTNLSDTRIYADLIREATEALERTTLQIRRANFYSKPKYTRNIFSGMVKKSQKVTILNKLNYPNYYRQMPAVARREGKFAERLHEATIRRAVTAIIVDSFAHNYGAHCLVELKWFFENRYKMMDQKFPVNNLQESPVGLQNGQFKPEKLRDFAKLDAFRDDARQFDPSMVRTELSAIDMIRYMGPEWEAQFLQFVNKDGQTIPARLPIPIDNAIYHFFRSLRDKSAFWSGVSRDIQLVGMSVRWLDLLEDFINNPLFLGTITHSEGVNRMNFFIEVYDQDGKQAVCGEFARVNMDVIHKERFAAGDSGNDYSAESLSQEEPPYSSYAFVREGKDYKAIKKVLEKLPELFLPNGVIGLQALYTILENTLRNIKHYKKYIEDVRKTGVQFFISIEESGFVERGTNQFTEEPKLFRVGTWLHHEQDLLLEGGTRGIIPEQWEQLKERIIDKVGRPRLGGSSQDKTCAAMLLNNTFSSVDEHDLNKAKRHYYPYIFPCSESYQTVEKRFDTNFQRKDVHLNTIYNSNLRVLPEEASNTHWGKDIDFYDQKNYEKSRILEKLAVMRATKYDHAKKEYINAHKEESKGLIKKYFHLWIAEDCLLLDPKEISERDFFHHENPSRFRIVAVRENDQELFHDYRMDLRSKGLVRIVQADEAMIQIKDQRNRYKYAIRLWLKDWLNINPSRPQLGFRWRKASEFSDDEWLGACQLSQDDNGEYTVNYFNQDDPQLREHNTDSLHSIVLSHSARESNQQVINIRSHGALMTDLFAAKFNYDDLDQISFDPAVDKAAPAENVLRLLEIVMTQIVMVDDRLHDRIPQRNSSGKPTYSTLEDYLKLSVYPEIEDWFYDIDKRKVLLKGTHFLVMHLSFIELLVDKEGKRYNESRLANFFQTEIAEFYEEQVDPGNSLPDHFFFIITSGRGNDQWVSQVRKTGTAQISFRPIEDLINAIEDGLTLRDDFQVKYNLCHVFFGS